MPDNKLTAEIFAVGKWNGFEFSAHDLKKIAESFNTLGDYLKVPLKFGHNNEQPMTDGMPALGWVNRVWVEGNKLMAEFSNMPSKVMDAIKNKLYRKVSVELDIDVSHKGKRYDYVLSGVALLGADIPAVSVLADLDHYLMRRASFSSGQKVVFSAIAGSLNSEGDNMEQLEKLTKQVADLTAIVATLTAENSQIKLSKIEADSKLAKFEAERQEREAEAQKAAMSAKRSEVVKVFDDAIKCGAITPAQKSAFSKVLRVEDDAALSMLDMEDVKALTAGNKANFSQQGMGAGNGQNEEDGRLASELVADKANKLMNEGKAASFSVAMQMVFESDKDLARRYLTENDKE